ncbi:hypothetical protein GT037_002325 [Alternaria burnsii]|uniref:Uncharacterized protein n=1 Tax=Alternaria burnsii TaxID=1187904 RepID=A0A8H7EJU2_9PLEO|nr:uncharacterized protein GT037_002325 [Alternaria burnsii]KAF7680674.1 hypothetical protein GT037_002325 [Alternaria burnsii]
MRFAAIIAALAVTATALPATSLEQTGASLVLMLDAQAAACAHQDSYDICRSNCSPLAPSFACQINCLIAYCA